MNLSASSPHLGRAREYADKLPEPPPREYVEELVPGDLVLLLDETPERTEPFWAEIDQILGPGSYLGRSQDGRGVRFHAEHIADLDYRRQPATMGAPWYDAFKQEAPKPRKPVTGPFRHFARGPRAQKTEESQEPLARVFRHFAPGAKPTPPPQAGPAGPKTSVFDVFKGWFKRKPKVETQPIPPEELRKPQGFSLLPYAGLRDVKEPEPRQEEPAPPPPIIIPPDPPAPPRGGGVIVISESALQPIAEQLPDDLFSVLGPSEEEKPLPPAPPVTSPGPVIMAPERGGLSIPGDVFSVLEPEAPSALSVPGAPSPFDILSEESPVAPGGIVVRPESGGAVTSSIFDVLTPEAPSGGGALAVPGSYSPFDVLPPERQAPGMAVYEPPPPVEPPTRETKPKRPSERKQKKSATPKLQKWDKPLEHWLEWFKETYNFQKMWESLREQLSYAAYIEAKEKEAEDEYEEPVYVPFETWADWEYETIFDFLGVPMSVWHPYMEAMQKEEEETGWSEESGERLNELIYSAVNGISEAFDHIKPKDITGRLGWASDDYTGTFGLMYHEDIPLEKLEKKRKESRASREKILRERKDLEKKRRAQVKDLMGPMPKVEDLVSWIEEHWDIEAMFKAIKAERKTELWKENMKYGGTSMTLEVVSDLSSARSKEYEYDIASYFGIPPGVVDLYADAESSQEIWNDIFWPFFEILSAAFDMLLPYANLPGRIVVDENDEDQMAILYTEDEPGRS